MARKTPRPHQLETLEFWKRNNGRGIDGCDPGFGKTLSCIMYQEHLDKWPCLVVCPSSVKGHWKREFEEYTGRKAVIVSGTQPYEGEVKHDLVIINYDILASQMPWLLDQTFQIITFDECHYLANTSTGWTKAARILGKRSSKIQGLSGTPIANRPADFWPVLNLIRPDLFPTFKAYAWRYCAPRYLERWGRWEYKGATRLDELHEIVKPFMLRRTKRELDLPEQTVRIDFVDMENQEAYQLLHNEYANAASGGFGPFQNKGINKLTLLANLLTLVARCKARGVVKWIKRYLEEHPTEKLLAFTTHQNMLDVLARRCLPEEQVITISGSVPSAKRTKLVDRFQNDPNTRLAVLNIKAASMGITLTAATKAVVTELPWSSKDVVQLAGRNHRIGQTRETELIFLLTKDTIEEKLCRVIQEKQNIHEAVIEGKKLDDLPLHKMLEREMANQG